MQKEGWGAKIFERLARDLREAFPNISGFSVRNLQYMRAFSTAYPEDNHAAALRKFPGGITC